MNQNKKTVTVYRFKHVRDGEEIKSRDFSTREDAYSHLDKLEKEFADLNPKRLGKPSLIVTGPTGRENKFLVASVEIAEFEPLKVSAADLRLINQPKFKIVRIVEEVVVWESEEKGQRRAARSFQKLVDALVARSKMLVPRKAGIPFRCAYWDVMLPLDYQVHVDPKNKSSVRVVGTGVDVTFELRKVGEDSIVKM